MKKKQRTPEQSSAAEARARRVRDISVEVYKRRLEHDSRSGAVARMLAADADGGAKLRIRAAFYDVVVSIVLDIIENEGRES